MRFSTLVGLTVLVMVATRAGGQTTQPAHEPWGKTVQDFAEALREGDAAGVVKFLSDEATIRSFDSRSADAVRLLARVKMGTLLLTRGYWGIPDTLATDLSDSAKRTDLDVPMELRQRIVYFDHARARRANVAAASWLSDAVGAKAGEALGVVVFACATGPADGQTPEHELVFVLVKPAGTSGQPRIKTIVFGNPLKQ